MDKNTFETYEYLSVNNDDTVSDHFFVIQDDRAFLLNPQVQYVTEVQDASETSEGTQSGAVYDANSEQFFVDVENNNPGELISVADNYILPPQVPDEVNNLYGNSFLLQNVGTDASEQAEKDLTITVQFKETEDEQRDNAVNVVNKQGSSCTEITLTDEQYKNLEQKGWVLLESNGKIFILDAFGLHEVTTNNDLIQNLKDDSKIDLPSEVDSTSSQKDSLIPCNADNLVANDTLQVEKILENPIKCEKRDIETENNLHIDIVNEEETQQHDKQDSSSVDVLEKGTNENKLHPGLEVYKSSRIKILSKHIFKDIPDKIFLGNTRNGKKLIAKVVKRTASKVKTEDIEETKKNRNKLLPKKVSDAKLEQSVASTELSNVEVGSLLRRAAAGRVRCGAGEAAHATRLVGQLLQVPEFSEAVAGHNIAVTRVLNKPSADGAARTISFVTGYVLEADNGKGRVFVHDPQLLQKLTQQYEDYFKNTNSRSVLKVIPEKAPPDCSIMQVHITESKQNDVQAISFVLNVRILPCKNLRVGQQVREKVKLHACSTCAAIFKTETELADHQETHATDSDGALTIDTDKLPKDVKTIMENNMDSYYIVKTDNGSEYCCLQCPKRFNKLTNCIRHMKASHPLSTALKPIINDPSAENKNCDKIEKDENGESFVMSIENLEAPYKCKMCSRGYHYPGSLSKHISKAHIVDKAHVMLENTNSNVK